MAGTNPHRETQDRAVCTCPDDCNCRCEWRTNYCGCTAHVSDYAGTEHACREFVPSADPEWSDVSLYRFSARQSIASQWAYRHLYAMGAMVFECPVDLEVQHGPWSHPHTVAVIPLSAPWANLYEHDRQQRMAYMDPTVYGPGGVARRTLAQRWEW